MKLKSNAPVKLKSDNVKAVKAWAQTPLHETPYYALLVMLADMCDTITKGENCYAIVGSTSNKTAFSLTVNISQDKDSKYGAGFEEIAAGAADWL